MEVDSVHSKIEKKIKGKEFYVPFDYVRSIREARSKPTEFNVVVLKYTDFIDFSNGYYTSVRPGMKKGEVTLREWNFIPVEVFESPPLIAEDKKPETIGESLIKPCLLIAYSTVLDEISYKEVAKISVSNNTVKRIDDIAVDLKKSTGAKAKDLPIL
ncbi:hypothetical protein J6590_076771 [Homalodisca vitripennis]|nr:hypothetical protein J6590_076771 [Homalodisca vitripennis]